MSCPCCSKLHLYMVYHRLWWSFHIRISSLLFISSSLPSWNAWETFQYHVSLKMYLCSGVLSVFFWIGFESGLCILVCVCLGSYVCLCAPLGLCVFCLSACVFEYLTLCVCVCPGVGDIVLGILHENVNYMEIPQRFSVWSFGGLTCHKAPQTDILLRQTHEETLSRCYSLSPEKG